MNTTKWSVCLVLLTCLLLFPVRTEAPYARSISYAELRTKFANTLFRYSRNEVVMYGEQIFNVFAHYRYKGTVSEKQALESFESYTPYQKVTLPIRYFEHGIFTKYWRNVIMDLMNGNFFIIDPNSGDLGSQVLAQPVTVVNGTRLIPASTSVVSSWKNKLGQIHIVKNPATSVPNTDDRDSRTMFQKQDAMAQASIMQGFQSSVEHDKMFNPNQQVSNEVLIVVLVGLSSLALMLVFKYLFHVSWIVAIMIVLAIVTRAFGSLLVDVSQAKDVHNMILELQLVCLVALLGTLIWHVFAKKVHFCCHVDHMLVICIFSPFSLALTYMWYYATIWADATSFELIQNSRIFFSALSMHFVLRKVVNKNQWLATIYIMFGSVLIQVPRFNFSLISLGNFSW